MQFYNKSNSIKNLLLFAVVLFIAYLPAASFMYFIKNDAFNGYFPPRFFMSESLHAGYLPLWNPYINNGFPQYGDMSGSYWSPLVWLFSLAGYNAWLFTLEIFLYIFLSGVAMYKLSGQFSTDRNTRLIAACIIIGCGFNSSHLQHVNWLSGLAFGIFLTDAILGMIKRPDFKQTLLFIFFGYLFISSSHPTIIISFAYFQFAILIFSYWKNEISQGWSKKTFTFLLSGIAGLILISAGLLTGYLDIIPFIQRATETGLVTATKDGVPFRAWSSLIFPMSVIKDNHLAGTELTMRNMYIGLPALLIIIHSVFSRKTKWQVFLLACAVIFMFLANGGIFKEMAYHALPLMNYVRLNGIFLAISTICFVLIAVIEYKKINQSPRWRMITFISMILFAAVTITAVIAVFVTRQSILFKDHNLDLKNIIDGITWYDTLLIQGMIQFLVCLLLHKAGQWQSQLKWIVIADIIIATLLNLPFTGVGQHSVSDVQAVLKHAPPGIPVPGNNPVILNNTRDSISHGLTGHWSMYGKQPGVTKWVPYPITLIHSWNYFESLRAGDSGHIYKPFAFIAGNPHPVQLTAFTGNRIEINSTPIQGQLIIQQNYFPHWKYGAGNSKKTVERFDDTFISAPVQPGGKTVFSFEPKRVKAAMFLSLWMFIILSVMLAYTFYRDHSNRSS